jgi:hypothetical protein
MKRSEMVELMWDFINEFEEYTSYMNKHSTNELLKKMESAMKMNWDSEEVTSDYLNKVADEMDKLTERRNEK